MKSLFAVALGAFTVLSLAGCASMNIQQLDPMTLQAKRAPEGAVYYLPKPYLLVARLPAPPAQATPQPKKLDNGGGNTGPAAAGDAGGSTVGAATPGSGGAADFLAQSGTYVMKLVYLPDYAHPMSITAKGGLFGIANISPTFQDGWMLTGFSGSIDNSKLADVLQQVVNGITAVRTPAANLGTPPSTAQSMIGNPDDEVLEPGLYEFEPDPATGHLTLHLVTYFSNSGLTSH